MKQVSELESVRNLDTVDSLEFPYDPELLPTSTEIPLGNVMLEGISMKEGRTRENTTGERNPRTGNLKVGNKVMVTLAFKVVEPEEYQGITHFHRIYLGTDLDPDAKGSAWKGQNATQMMNLFHKVLDIHGKTPPEYAAAFVGSRVGATVRKGRENPPYPARNEIREFWKPGTKQVKVEGEVNGDLNEAFGRSVNIPNHPAYQNKD